MTTKAHDLLDWACLLFISLLVPTVKMNGTYGSRSSIEKSQPFSLPLAASSIYKGYYCYVSMTGEERRLVWSYWGLSLLLLLLFLDSGNDKRMVTGLIGLTFLDIQFFYKSDFFCRGFFFSFYKVCCTLRKSAT